MIDIKAILSAASGVCRSPKARGAAALAVIAAGTVALASVDGKQEQIDTVPLETDTVVTEAEPVKAEKKARTYARDLEYLSEEDLAAMNRTAEDDSADTADEAEEAEEYGSDENIGYTSCAECADDDNDADEYDSSDEDSNGSSADTDSDSDEEAYDEAGEDSSGKDEDSGANETDSVSTYGYAADGEDGDTGLSSTLDMESDHESNGDTDADEDGDSSDEAAAAAPKWVPLSTAGSDDDGDDCAEIITLDDEDVPAAETAEEVPVPQEGAISRFALPEGLELDENGVPTNYSNILSGNACAYTADPGALMSTGKEVFQGYVAVDPDIIPYGTELYIIADDGEVYGYAIAGDTGYSVRAGDIIVDLFMDEYDDCIQWGNKGVKIYVLG